MDDHVTTMANSLIAIHGTDAVGAAKRAAERVRSMGLHKNAEEWEQIAVAIEAIQKTQASSG